jgi:hypothetical protein
VSSFTRPRPTVAIRNDPFTSTPDGCGRRVCANSGQCPTAWLAGEIDPKPSSEWATLPPARGFAVQTPLRRRYPTTDQILQCVAATAIPMAKGISEAMTIPIPIVLSLRVNLHSALSDGRSRHSGSGGRSHWRWQPAPPRFQSTQSSFESRIVSAYASGLVGDGEIAGKR